MNPLFVSLPNNKSHLYAIFAIICKQFLQHFFSLIFRLLAASLINTFFFLKVKLSEKSSMLEAAEAQIAELTAKVNEQQGLIVKLEDDILKV